MSAHSPLTVHQLEAGAIFPPRMARGKATVHMAYVPLSYPYAPRAPRTASALLVTLNRTPSTISLDPPGAEVGDLVRRDKP